MQTYSVTAGGHTVAVDVIDPAQITALHDVQAQNQPDLTPESYLNLVLERWATTNPDASADDITDAARRALRSYAKQPPVVVLDDTPRTPTVADVHAERDRRLSRGFDYDFGGARGVHHIGTSPADMVGWGEVSTYAGALLDMGDVETKIAIVTDTGPCQVTAPEWRAIEVAAAAFRQPIWAKSFVLSALLPTDYANDAQWT